MGLPLVSTQTLVDTRDIPNVFNYVDIHIILHQNKTHTINL
jgi:hypothetical protein